MKLDIVFSVFKKELRELLRDRRSLAVMVGIPLLLYPLVAIGVATLASSKTKEQKERPAQVAMPNAGAAPTLYAMLKDEAATGIKLVLPDDIDAALQKGDADAAIDVPLDTERKALAGEGDIPKISVRLDRSRTAAGFAQRKIEAVLDKYERWIIEQRLQQHGVPATVLAKVRHETVDIARGDQLFGKVLAQMLPLLLLMTGMLGALFPALNATTTERELGTLETLLVTPAGRTELLVAKAMLVLICGLLTAGLNMLSMSLVLKRSLSMLDQEMLKNISISTPALLLTFVAAIPALMFFTTIVLIIGLLARNFREANAFATPIMLLPLASLAVGILEPAATPGVLVTPIANTTVIIRDVLTGRATFGAFALAFASSLVYAGLMLSIAARLFSNEQLVNPAWEPLSVKGFGRRGGTPKRPRRVPAVDEAIGLFVVSLLLIFYVTPSVVKHGLLVVIAVNQLLLILAPCLLFAWLGRWKWRETFSLRWPGFPALAGGVLVGIGLVPWALLLIATQNEIWPRVVDDTLRANAELMAASLNAYPVLTIVLVGALAGLCEEALFRGPLQSAMSRRLSPPVAILVTAVLFGLAHMDLHGLALRTFLGCVLGYVVWRGGSIFPAMLLHAFYNASQLTYGYLKSKAAGATDSLEDISLLKADAETFILLATGAALLVFGSWLLNRRFREHDANMLPLQPATPSAFPVVQR